MPQYFTMFESINLNILFGSLNISVKRLEKIMPDENMTYYEHFHSDFEFHIIPQGRGFINIEGYDFEANQGEFYITGPFIKHTQYTDKKNPMMIYCIECDMNISKSAPSEDEAAAEENRLLIRILSNCIPMVFKDQSGITAKFEEIIVENEKKSLGYFLKIQTLLVSILIDIFRTVSSNMPDKYFDAFLKKALDKQRVDRLLNYIHTNYKNDISVKDATNVLFLCERQINRIMKSNLNQTFHEYLLSYRISMAKKLLEEGSTPMEDIALESGFSSLSYMYQVFKKFKYPTPAQLRTANK